MFPKYWYSAWFVGSIALMTSRLGLISKNGHSCNTGKQNLAEVSAQEDIVTCWLRMGTQESESLHLQNGARETTLDHRILWESSKVIHKICFAQSRHMIMLNKWQLDLWVKTWETQIFRLSVKILLSHLFKLNKRGREGNEKKGR